MSNKYTYSVPFTEEQMVHDYVQLRMSQAEIAQKYGTTQKVVWRAMHKMGVPTRSSAKRNQSGPLNLNWHGGRVLAATKAKPSTERSSFGNGYYYLRDPEHPNANRHGYVAEHIVAAVSARGGRPLQKGEMVHHINLDKHDNRPVNLCVTDAKEHARWHAQLEEIAVSFMREGRIAFDPTSGYRRLE